MTATARIDGLGIGWDRLGARGRRRPRAAESAGDAPPRCWTGPLHWFLWLLFNSACVAASVALMWFARVVPLPALLRGVGWLTSVVLVPLALPQMTDGCDPEWVEPGDRLRVLYGPEGASGPLEDEDTVAPWTWTPARTEGHSAACSADRRGRNVGLRTAESAGQRVGREHPQGP